MRAAIMPAAELGGSWALDAFFEAKNCGTELDSGCGTALDAGCGIAFDAGCGIAFDATALDLSLHGSEREF